MEAQLLRAASGTGIVNLHHTITRYAIERGRHFFTDEEYRHLIAAWVEFMQDKKTRAVEGDRPKIDAAPDPAAFRTAFARLDEKSVSSLAAGMMDSEQGRKTFGRFLIRGVSELYQGDYNPHFLTGLGSFLWVMENYGNRPAIAATALAQYLNFYLGSMKGG